MNSNDNQLRIPFWNSAGQIIPHLLYEFLNDQGIGLYFPDDANMKNSEPVIVKVVENIVCQVNVGHLLEVTKCYILKVTAETGNSGPILDSLHTKTALFGDKNLKLLKTLKLIFLSDTPEAGYFFFKNGVVEVTAVGITLRPYSDFDQYVWESSIIPFNFTIVEEDAL